VINHLLATAPGGIYENTFKVFSPFGQLALLAVLKITVVIFSRTQGAQLQLDRDQKADNVFVYQKRWRT